MLREHQIDSAIEDATLIADHTDSIAIVVPAAMPGIGVHEHDIARMSGKFNAWTTYLPVHEVIDLGMSDLGDCLLSLVHELHCLSVGSLLYEGASAPTLDIGKEAEQDDGIFWITQSLQWLAINVLANFGFNPLRGRITREANRTPSPSWVEVIRVLLQ